MNTEKFVVGIRRQLLRNKRNYFACCPNVKTNSCMEMNVLNSHRNIFKFFWQSYYKKVKCGKI